MAGSEGSGDEKKYRKKPKSGSRDRRNDSEESGEEHKSKDKKYKEKKGGKYSGGESGDEDKKYKKEKKSKDKDDMSEDEGEKAKKKDKDSKHKKSKSKDEGHSEKKEKKKDKGDKKHKEEQSEEEDGGDGDYKKKKEKDKGKDKEKKRDDEGSDKKDKKSKSEGSHEHKLAAGGSGLGEIGKIPGVGQTAAKVASVFASSEAWIEAAKKTTAEFKQGGPKSPTTWVLAEGNNILADAIRAGEDKTGVPFYVARAFYEGALHIGRASKNGAFIGHNGREISVPLYEILLGDTSAIRWVPSSAGPTGVRPVEGGVDSSGKPLMIAQTMYGGEVIPGKAMDWINGALVALGGKEINVKDYNILAYT